MWLAARNGEVAPPQTSRYPPCRPILSCSSHGEPNVSLESTQAAERTGLALIMKGGGMKGLAYIGALQELRRYYSFDMYAGTSAGAITAALLGAGYTADELRSIMMETDFSAFLPERLSRLTNLIFYGGLYRGIRLTL